MNYICYYKNLYKYCAIQDLLKLTRYFSTQLCSLAILSKMEPSDCTRLTSFRILCPKFRELHRLLLNANSVKTIPKDQISVFGFGEFLLEPSK